MAIASAKSPLVWRHKEFPLLPASPNGIGKLSTNCSPMKSTQAGYCSRRLLVLASLKLKTMAEQYLYTGTHESIISDEMFSAV